jgi:hypothetical protein
MNSEQSTQPAATPPKPSTPFFDDLPVVALLDVNTSTMSQEEKVAFVTRIRSLRQVHVFKAAVREESSRKVKAPKTKPGPSLDKLLDDLMKE